MLSRSRSGFVAAFSVLVVALAFGTGCDSPGFGRKAKAPTTAVPSPSLVGQTATTSARVPDRANSTGPGVETASLSVSNEIATACSIASRNDGAAPAPTFEFDSAALAPDDRALLAQVARCITEGSLRGEQVTLVGRTDPRGEPEYNMTLGGSRADSVHRYMTDLGVARAQMTTTSRGEIDATGTNEAGWAHDRRVDIELVKKK